MPTLREQSFAKPFYIFFLVLPEGISNGFVTVALPYLLTKNGFSVAETAGIVAIGLGANLWRFIWGPIADLTLTLRKWFWVGVLVSSVLLAALCFLPLTPKGAVLLTVIVFISQVAATFILLPVGGFMANRIPENKKGSAGGWFQAGNLGGTGLGGGAGLWLATHYSVQIAGVVLAAASIVFALVVMLIKDVQHNKEKSFVVELGVMGKDLLGMVKVPVVLFVIILVCLPIGSGAMSNVWSSIAGDWKTNADTVALATGILSGLASAIGCIAGGFMADRWGNFGSYMVAGLLTAIITIIMAVMPMQPYIYVSGVLAYAFGSGMCYGIFSSVILFAIGKKNASTKYSLLSSLGNIPVVAMTAFDGWFHDKTNSKLMLIAEGAVGIFFIIICTFVIIRMKSKNLLVQPT